MYLTESKKACNMKRPDKFLRITAGIILLIMVTSGYIHFLWMLLSLMLLYTGFTGHCLLYSMLGINKKFSMQNYYLSHLPRFNPEPVYVFNNKNKLIYKNEISDEMFPGIKSLKELADDDKINNELQTEAVNRKFIKKSGDFYYQFVAKSFPSLDLILIYGFDITDRVNYEKRIEMMAVTDELTGLFNRKKLVKIMEEYAADKIILLNIDIKNFGQINSYYGNKTGDKLLQDFAENLKDYSGRSDLNTYIFRLHSDVYALLVCISEHTEGGLLDIAKNEAYELDRFLNGKSISIDNFSYTPTLTYGISHNEDFESPNFSLDMINRAETALREAKQRKLKVISYCQIQEETEEKYRSNIIWTTQLKRALNKEEGLTLKPYYQPIKDIKKNKITKSECLIRMLDNNQAISPAKFLPPAEQLGLLPEITKVVIDESFKLFSKSSSQFSINISAQDLSGSSIEDYLYKKCNTYEIDPSSVTLEILENDDLYQFSSRILKLKDKGFKIAIDDFGTGYSNFGKHQEINVDYIKIDGSLIRNINTSPQSCNTVRSIINYTKSLGAETIAEFVSGEDIYREVSRMGIDYAQGFYIGKPAPSD